MGVPAALAVIALNCAAQSASACATVLPSYWISVKSNVMFGRDVDRPLLRRIDVAERARVAGVDAGPAAGDIAGVAGARGEIGHDVLAGGGGLRRARHGGAVDREDAEPSWLLLERRLGVAELVVVGEGIAVALRSVPVVGLQEVGVLWRHGEGQRGAGRYGADGSLIRAAETGGDVADGDGVVRMTAVTCVLATAPPSPAAPGSVVFEPIPVPVSHMPTVMP